MSITVRIATPADHENIVHGNQQIARETEHIELDPCTVNAGVKQALADPAKAIYFVAECDGSFAGQLMVTKEWSDWRNGDIWWIQSVYVMPEFRRIGAFRALYSYVRELARSERIAGLRLYVEKENSPAQNTYLKLGMIDAHYIVMEEMFTPAAAGVER